MFENIISKIAKAVVVVFLSLAIGLAFMQIILRNFFSSGIEWADVTIRHMVLWIGFFGAILAAIEKRHITLDVFSRVLPEKINRYVQSLIYLGSSVVCAILTYASYKFVESERLMGGVLFEGIPIWIAQAVIPLTFALVGMVFITKIKGSSRL